MIVSKLTRRRIGVASIDDLEIVGIQEVAMYGNKLLWTVNDLLDAEKRFREIAGARRLKVLSLREIAPSLEDNFVSVITR